MTSFEEWLRAVVDHPVSEPAWYWQDGFDEQWGALGLTSPLAVAHFTRLLRNPAVLAPYSRDQVAQAIWFLVSESSRVDVSDTLLDQGVSTDSRVACIQAMAHFFSQFVAVVSPGAADPDDELGTACFMWWDIFPVWRDQRAEPSVSQACLEVMRGSLELPSDLCKLSALHGLNHWYRHYGREADSIVEAFLRDESLSAKVREYGAIARVGGSQ